MGWRGTLKSMAAASRRSAKNAERRYKEQQKIETYENAISALKAWENYLDGLMAIHIDLADSIDWTQILSSKRPIEPTRTTVKADEAQLKIESFKPSMFNVFKGGSQKIRSKLEIDLEVAIKADEGAYHSKLDDFERDLVEWYEDRALAKKILDNDLDAQKGVLDEYLNGSLRENIGTSIEFEISSTGIHVQPNIHGDQIVPKFRRKILASGKLSETPMPAAQFNELYQDYVASVALKMAGDIFHVLPVSQVWVTCKTEILNKATGHIENTPILSVQFVRSTFQRINLETIDTSDCLALFNHRMSFTKKSGFSAIEPFQPSGS
jgi:hypothetical protein